MPYFQHITLYLSTLSIHFGQKVSHLQGFRSHIATQFYTLLLLGTLDNPATVLLTWTLLFSSPSAVSRASTFIWWISAEKDCSAAAAEKRRMRTKNLMADKVNHVESGSQSRPWGDRTWKGNNSVLTAVYFDKLIRQERSGWSAGHFAPGKISEFNTWLWRTFEASFQKIIRHQWKRTSALHKNTYMHQHFSLPALKLVHITSLRQQTLQQQDWR